MGNCQAAETAALVIQYPGGKTERLYWSISASDVMKMNPGYYVSLVLPVTSHEERKSVRFTRVKLLRSSETLVLGRAYRLVTTEEVMKVLQEKNYERTSRSRRYSDGKSLMDRDNYSSSYADYEKPEKMEKTSQSMRHEIYRQRPTAAKRAMTRSKSWCPSLQSISEVRSLQ